MSDETKTPNLDEAIDDVSDYDERCNLWDARKEDIAAARLDAEDAYRRGVEDGKNRAYASAAGTLVSLANVEKLPGAVGMSLYALADVFEARALRATEEKQRLERLKEGNGNG